MQEFPLTQQDMMSTATNAAGLDTECALPIRSKLFVFDRAGALEGVSGDSALLRELARMFLDLSPAMLSKVKLAVADRDFEGTQRTVRALKGAAGHFGADKVAAAACALAGRAKARDASMVDSVYFDLEAAVAVLQTALEKFVAE
jgi:HPt (histidine-containing phosphotransfer) domain-containing protein